MQPGDLLMILNAGYRRKGANVVRMEKCADGGFNRVRFRTFTGMAFAGIKKLPDTLQDRSIVVSLQRASAGELKAHLTDGDSAVLNNICRKLTRWRADLADSAQNRPASALANRLGEIGIRCGRSLPWQVVNGLLAPWPPL